MNFKFNDGRKMGSFNSNMKPGYDYRMSTTRALGDGGSREVLTVKSSGGKPAQSDAEFKRKHADFSLDRSYPTKKMHSGLVY